MEYYLALFLNIDSMQLQPLILDEIHPSLLKIPKRLEEPKSIEVQIGNIVWDSLKSGKAAYFKIEDLEAAIAAGIEKGFLEKDKEYNPNMTLTYLRRMSEKEVENKGEGTAKMRKYRYKAVLKEGASKMPINKEDKLGYKFYRIS